MRIRLLPCLQDIGSLHRLVHKNVFRDCMVYCAMQAVDDADTQEACAFG